MSSADRQFAEECLTAINRYRSNHQVEPLTYSRDIEQVSKKWADRMAQTGIFGHNPNDSYRGSTLGENIASQWSSNRDGITGDQVAEQWYSEIKDYDFQRHRSRGGVTGHFTQVVWKDSRELGIARAQTRDGTWMVVANFFPPGNFNDDDANNVFPPKHGISPSVINKDKDHRHNEDAARIVSNSNNTEMSTVNGVSTTTTTETTTDEDGVKRVKVTEKVKRPGSGPKVTVTLTTTKPDGRTSEETWTE